MSVRMMSLVWELDLPDSEKLVLLALADWANDEGRCWPSINGLARKCSKGARTVQNSIRTLEAKGHLTQHAQDRGRQCHYTVHPIVRISSDPRSNCTPAEDAPPQRTTRTPAAAAPKPLRTTNSSEAKASSQYAAPDGVPDETWADFLKSPKRRKAGMSKTAYSGIVNNLTKLAEHGYPPGAMVALAVERGWATIKLEWVEGDGRRNSLGRHQPANDGFSSTARAANAVFG